MKTIVTILILTAMPPFMNSLSAEDTHFEVENSTAINEQANIKGGLSIDY